MRHHSSEISVRLSALLILLIGALSFAAAYACGVGTSFTAAGISASLHQPPPR